MMSKYAGFLALLVFFMSCREKSVSVAGLSIQIPKDSCYIQELIAGVAKDKIDTLCFIRINLQSGSKKFFLSDKINIGIEVIKKMQGESYIYNLDYSDFEQVKTEHFISESEKNGNLRMANFYGEKKAKNIDAAFQVISDSNGAVVIAPQMLSQQRLQLIAEMFKERSGYSEVIMYTALTDVKSVYVMQGGK